jgi:hypothetical protein
MSQFAIVTIRCIGPNDDLQHIEEFNQYETQAQFIEKVKELYAVGKGFRAFKITPLDVSLEVTFTQKEVP